MKTVRKKHKTYGIIMAMLIITGCRKIESADPDMGYSTVFAMSAVEYSIFLSKEISAIENTLITRYSMADSVIEGSYATESEIRNTEEAITKIESIKDELTVTMPATNYESDRDNILSLAEESLMALEDYLTALQNSDYTEIDTSAKIMKNCCIALSGEANLYYE